MRRLLGALVVVVAGGFSPGIRRRARAAPGLTPRAGLDAAELNLQFSEVRAPISGRIGRALLTEGALVDPSGEVLATIQQLDPVYADFTQSANQTLRLRRAPHDEHDERRRRRPREPV